MLPFNLFSFFAIGTIALIVVLAYDLPKSKWLICLFLAASVAHLLFDVGHQISLVARAQESHQASEGPLDALIRYADMMEGDPDPTPWGEFALQMSCGSSNSAATSWEWARCS